MKEKKEMKLGLKNLPSGYETLNTIYLEKSLEKGQKQKIASTW